MSEVNIQQPGSVDSCLDYVLSESINRKNKQEKLKLRAEIERAMLLHEFVYIGCDYFEATGSYPSEAKLTNLHQNGYLENAPWLISELLKSRRDKTGYTAYYQMIDKALAQRQEDQLSAKQEIMTVMAKTTVPERLYRQKERIEGSSKPELYRLTDEFVDEDEKISRFAKFKFALDAMGRDSDDPKLLSIVLGFNLQSGRLGSSFVGKVYSGATLKFASAEEVRRTIEAHPWHDFIFPRSHNHLVVASFTPKTKNAVGSAAIELAQQEKDEELEEIAA